MKRQITSCALLCSLCLTAFCRWSNFVPPEKVDVEDVEWTVTFVKNDWNWCDILLTEDGAPVSFYMIPYYSVDYELTGRKKNADTDHPLYSIKLPLLWPSVYAWTQLIHYDEGNPVPPDQRDYRIVGLNEMFEANPKEYGKIFWYTDGYNTSPYYNIGRTFIQTFPIAPETWCKGKGWPQLFGNDTTYLQTFSNLTYSTIKLESLDPITGAYKIPNDLFFKNDKNIKFTYSAPIQTKGYNIAEWYFITKNGKHFRSYPMMLRCNKEGEAVYVAENVMLEDVKEFRISKHSNKQQYGSQKRLKIKDAGATYTLQADSTDRYVKVKLPGTYTIQFLPSIKKVGKLIFLKE